MSVDTAPPEDSPMGISLNLNEIISTLKMLEYAPNSFSPLGFLTPDKFAEYDSSSGEASLKERGLVSPGFDGPNFDPSYTKAFEVVCQPIFCTEVVNMSFKNETMDRVHYWGNEETIVKAQLSEEGLKMSSPMPKKDWASTFCQNLLGKKNTTQAPLILPKTAYDLCLQFSLAVPNLPELNLSGLKTHIQSFGTMEDTHIEQIIEALHQVGILHISNGANAPAFGHPMWQALAQDKNIQVMIRDENGNANAMSFCGLPGNKARVFANVNNDPELLMATWPTAEDFRQELLDGLHIAEAPTDNNP
ncbi:MAG: hypothetical protein VYA34_09075 [Myxococcota bacterium]|nr:hypothetical protein [Myxococcota bacterium]